MAEKESYIVLCTSENMGVTSKTNFEVTAASPEEALKKAKEDRRLEGATLRAIYKDWEYNYKGAIKGNLVWKKDRGFV